MALGQSLAAHVARGRSLFALHPSDLEGDALGPSPALLLTVPQAGPSAAGTPRSDAVAPYAAPEVLRLGAVTESSWVYSLGVVLFEALTGHRPFEGSTASALAVRQILEAPPPVDRLRPGLPPELVAFVASALAKQPADRPASLSACVAALSAWQGPEVVPSLALAAPASPSFAPPSFAPPSAMAPQPAMLGAPPREAFAYAATVGAPAPARSRRGAWGIAVVLGVTGLLGLGAFLTLGTQADRGPVGASAPAAPAPPPVAPVTAAPSGGETGPREPSRRTGGPRLRPGAVQGQGQGQGQGQPVLPAPEVAEIPAPQPTRVVPPAAGVRPQPTDEEVWTEALMVLGFGLAGAALAGWAWTRRRARRRATHALKAAPTPEPTRLDSGAYDQTVRAVTGPAVTRDGAVVRDPTIVDAHGGGGPSTMAPPPMAAFTLGTYECLERLGEGGMGVVYRARHTTLGRPCAVKVLLPQRVLDAEAMTQFQREAQLAAQINHPHSVTIYDFGAADGLLYLAMELIEGPSLAALADAGPLALPRVVALVEQVCDALDAAHALGIVHRDLKPANLMVTARRGRDFVKIVDFGIARGFGPAGPHTLAGVVVGTPAYMAPEQARGEPDLDARADVFSLGVVVYELLTGALPFAPQGHTALSQIVSRATLSEPPIPPSSRAPTGTPPAVDAVVLEALAPRRESRTRSATEFATRLATAAGRAA